MSLLLGFILILLLIDTEKIIKKWVKNNVVKDILVGNWWIHREQFKVLDYHLVHESLWHIYAIWNFSSKCNR